MAITKMSIPNSGVNYFTFEAICSSSNAGSTESMTHWRPAAGDLRAGDAGPHPLPRLPRPPRLLHLGTLLPQRDPQWGLVAKRDACALALLADGLGTACQ